MSILGSMLIFCSLMVAVMTTTTRPFFLRNRTTRKCIDVSGTPGLDNRDNIQSWDCEFDIPYSDQIWTMDLYGRLISHPSVKCMDVKGDRDQSNSVTIQLYSCEDVYDNETDHIWELDYQPGTEFFRIKNKYTGKCVDVKGWSSLSNGVNIQQYSCEPFSKETSDQWWEIVYVDGL